jgi:hypothetical protein
MSSIYAWGKGSRGEDQGFFAPGCVLCVRFEVEMIDGGAGPATIVQLARCRDFWASLPSGRCRACSRFEE